MDRGKYLVMHKGRPHRVDDEGEVVRLLHLFREEYGFHDMQGFSAIIDIYILANGRWEDVKARFL